MVAPPPRGSRYLIQRSKYLACGLTPHVERDRLHLLIILTGYVVEIFDPWLCTLFGVQ